MSNDSKIFVIGSPRSGTTVIANALRSVIGTQGRFSEFHLFSLYGELLKGVDSFYNIPTTKEASQINGMLLNEYHRNYFESKIAELVRNIYAETIGSKSFIDKTPGIFMVNSVLDVLRVWPKAKVIFAKRRGIENVISRMKKFPNESFENHCLQWHVTMVSWFKVKQSCIQGGLENSLLEVDQMDIVRKVETVTKELGDLLLLDQNQINELAIRFNNDRPEQSSDSYNPISLNEVDWSMEKKDFFRRTCEKTMRLFNYSLDESYQL